MQLFKTVFLNRNFLSTFDQVAYNQTWVSFIHAEHPSALKVIMIGDQLTYLKAPFYNFNCSKPNGSANPFGEAQNTPPRSHLGTTIQMLLGTPSNKELSHQTMHEVQFLPQFSPNISKKTFR